MSASSSAVMARIDEEPPAVGPTGAAGAAGDLAGDRAGDLGGDLAGDTEPGHDAAAATQPVDDDPDRLVGRELTPFRITAAIGHGAMGRVYAAEHMLLGRRVAIKVLEPRLARDAECAARFVEEARAVGRIRHPHIVDIIDFGELDGRPYYVMELLGGETLAARIRREGGLPVPVALAISIEVASALAAAHDHGVVHRDLKPDNIFLCDYLDEPDRVKVLDFGVAKVLRNDGPDAVRIETQAGRLMGTPLYMSPEQCLGKAVDHRADVYALGVVLFECLTGVAPFVRDGWLEVLMAHVSDEAPRPSTLRDEVPPAVEAIVMRALAKEPEARFSDMRAMRSALVEVGRRIRRASRSAPVRALRGPMSGAVASVQAQAQAQAPTPSPTPSPSPSTAGQVVAKPLFAKTSAEQAAKAAVARPPAPASAPAPAAGAASLMTPAAAPANSAALPPAIAGGNGPLELARGAGIAEVLRKIIVTRLESGRLVLPSLPASVAATLAELRAPNADLAHIARVLGTDPLIAPQLLNLAGSAFYCSNRPPQTLLQAVIQLGVVRLRSLLLELSTRRVFASPRRGVRAAFDGMWGHSLAVAELARRICAELGNPAEADGVHLGGLLHDVGKPVVGALLLEAEKLLGDRFAIDPATWIDVVSRSHRAVAVALAESWKLDPLLSHVVAGCGAYGDETATNIVCMANAVAKRAWRTVGPVDREAVDELIAEGADLLRLDWKFVHALPHQLSP
ncbi:MAG TPA: HDOD domain-containing protein [Kofleriaceae bacterium]|nr:HDOD domain-containing protein [Kofleriaceae bacterium]